ncbi:hypothetical protein BGAL_0345g00090 [Botrytis galanthina]|uniref:Uncharacterized protein n=1 Tax=Botrytis galanthina TaxID=278940 RepID=A0A4S8R1F6_9HELO|nr:hypothetical protein BGAL_0345g00090 [Botrytis galanthina]
MRHCISTGNEENNGNSSNLSGLAFERTVIEILSAMLLWRVFVLVTDDLLKWQIVHKGYDAAKIKHHKSQVISMIEDVEDLCMVRVWLYFVDFGKC